MCVCVCSFVLRIETGWEHEISFTLSLFLYYHYQPKQNTTQQDTPNVVFIDITPQLGQKRRRNQIT